MLRFMHEPGDVEQLDSGAGLLDLDQPVLRKPVRDIVAGVVDIAGVAGRGLIQRSGNVQRVLQHGDGVEVQVCGSHIVLWKALQHCLYQREDLLLLCRLELLPQLVFLIFLRLAEPENLSRRGAAAQWALGNPEHELHAVVPVVPLCQIGQFLRRS